MKVLGIETSCDETGVAILEEDNKILSSIVFTQDTLHSKFGGVVPELAARKHMQVLIPAVKNVFEKSGLRFSQIDGIACTIGPGLMGSLITGVSFSKALALSLNVPFVGIDHLEAHANAIFLERKVDYPFIALVISGGHTSIFIVNHIGDIQLLGKTVDDAAGEAFDKAAKFMGLGYPGGPIIDKLARNGNPEKYNFPRAMKKSDDFNVSFSGLKTALINLLKKEKSAKIEDVCASFQEAVIDTVLVKVKLALKQHNAKRFVLSGGVAANNRLRKKAEKLCKKLDVEFHVPSPKLCTDNGCMVAYVGAQYLRMNLCDPLHTNVYSRWKGVDIGKKIRTTLPQGS